MMKPGGRLKLDSSRKISKDFCEKSFGACMLVNRNLVVPDCCNQIFKVNIYSQTGDFIKKIEPKESFSKLGVCLLLSDGSFAVLDKLRIHGFDSSGDFLWNILLPSIPSGSTRHYGLAEDSSGYLITIQENKFSSGNNRNTYLLKYDLESKSLVEKIFVLKPVKDSKCRFLSFASEKFYVTDLGLDRVYIIDPSGKIDVVGKTGVADDCFNDPAGTVVDDYGNFIIADSRNHKLALYSSDLQFVCKLVLNPPTRRPSDIFFSSDRKSLVVLNLHGSNRIEVYPLDS